MGSASLLENFADQQARGGNTQLQKLETTVEFKFKS
jgi:hypothetical protein